MSEHTEKAAGKAAILPTAVYTADELAAILPLSAKTLKRLPLRWIRQGHRTKVVLGEDVLAYFRGKRAA